MDHAANIFTTLMVVAARWAGCWGDHMVCGGMSAPCTQELRTCRQAQVLSGVITENPQTNKFKQSAFANMCWCLFKVAIVCSFDSDKGVYVYMHIAKQRTMPSWSCLCHAQCHVLSRVNICNKAPHILSSGSGGVWVVPGHPWALIGQHATIRLWSIFEGLSFLL